MLAQIFSSVWLLSSHSTLYVCQRKGCWLLMDRSRRRGVGVCVYYNNQINLDMWHVNGLHFSKPKAQLGAFQLEGVELLHRQA